jgi:hypothetical protein
MLIRTQEVSPKYVNLTVEELSYREDGRKYASTFTVRYVKVGNNWRVLSVENSEIRRTDEGER